MHDIGLLHTLQVGVTANPVKVRTITDFGSVKDVGDKLLDAERRKVSSGASACICMACHCLGCHLPTYASSR